MITGSRLTLRELTLEDATERYLAWLNDPELQRFTRRRSKRTTMKELRQFLETAQSSDDVFFAIVVNEHALHIGNIFLNSVDRENNNADLSIMIGDRECHGKGYAQEAMQLMCKHAFESMGLHRLYAASPNAAFNRVVEKLGWAKEGVRREDFYLEGRYLDMECWSVLRPEWMRLNSE